MVAKARNPVLQSTLEKLGAQDLGLTTGAVCVYPARVKDAAACVGDSGAQPALTQQRTNGSYLFV